MRYFSAFTGVGGFELGMPKTWKCVGFSEIDKYASQVLKYRFPQIKNYGDITKIVAEKFPEFDLIVGGFPCQSFSIAGKRGGFKDTRGTLFFDLARIVKEKKPSYLLLENVKGLINHNKGNTFATIISTIDELGYDCQWCVLNGKDFGVPQNRERVFIVGHIRGIPRPKVFSFGKHSEETIGKAKKQGKYVSNTLRTNYSNGRSSETYILKELTNGMKIRRLIPIECERLMSWPDNWTKWGINEKGEKVEMSDTQRYKMCGNGVISNIIIEITRELGKL